MGLLRGLVVGPGLGILLVISLLLVGTSVARDSTWPFDFQRVKGSGSANMTITPNYMYDNSFVTVKGFCSSKDVGKEQLLQIRWMLIQIDCAENFYKIAGNIWLKIFEDPTPFTILPANHTLSEEGGDEDRNGTQVATSKTYFQFSYPQQIKCSDGLLVMSPKDESDAPYIQATIYSDAEVAGASQLVLQNVAKPPPKNNNTLPHRVTRVWGEGIYHFYLQIVPLTKNASFRASGIIEMRGSDGYLSAIDWPMLPITGIMSVLYLVAGTAWIFFWAQAQEHTQKIHIVIGLVAVAGALGNTLSFADYSVRNADGLGISGIHWIGQLVSTIQISLTYLLLMVVSTGYGINRPTLSQQSLTIMVVLAAVNFFTSAAFLITSDESMKIKYTEPSAFTTSVVVFAISNILVTGWIMFYSIYTFVYLFERRHSSLDKLHSFSLFMAACITDFSTQMIMAAFAIASGIFVDCRKDWKYQWVSSSFSDLEVFGLLVVLMWLWRPVDENKSYAFRPVGTVEEIGLLDEDELNEEKIMLEEF